MSHSTQAPQLESPLGWLNTDQPLRIGQELKGHVVLLDFWTYCCINCIHILPDLKYIEDKYKDAPLVVIGVHSAKFTNEAQRQTIRSAIHRYEIAHPVIVDDRMNLWRAYGVRSWPTFVLIDPEGCVVGTLSGEGQREALDDAVGQVLAHHRSRGTLATEPLRILADAAVEPATGLAFPGKVLADADGKRLFISDSNHNRIVVTTWPDAEGHCKLIQCVGSGSTGAQDGPAETASLDHPQGMAIRGDLLYVADTENHLIRQVDLLDWTVTTVIGTGRMGNDRAGGGMGVQQEINSPWDLAAEGGTLYIAMAGSHQIWRAEMPIGFARALAGSGRENIVDGPVETAALSQPSGICLHKGKIYFADSEVSAIRGIDLATEKVFTVIGEGLFSFGDADGAFPKAKLQHCLGVTSWHEMLLVADTYNHKIKLIDPAARSAATLYGLGRPAAIAEDGKPAFYEPGGLHAVGDTLFVADTNNHRVVMIDLKTHRWSEVKIDGLYPPASLADADRANVIDVPPASIAPDREIEFSIDVALPPGVHLNAEAPWTARVSCNGTVIAQATGFSAAPPIQLTVPSQSIPEKTIWLVDCSLVCCTDAAAARCVPIESSWRVPVRSGGTNHRVFLAASIGALA